MFDIGFPELVMIAVIALLVIGPDKLPGVARTAGKWVGRARRFVSDVKTDIDRELKQEELRKALAEDAGLDEIKQIMNADNFIIEEDDTPDYQVKSIDDEHAAFNEKILQKERDMQQAAEKKHDIKLEKELKKSAKKKQVKKKTTQKKSTAKKKMRKKTISKKTTAKKT